MNLLHGRVMAEEEEDEEMSDFTWRCGKIEMKF